MYAIKTLKLTSYAEIQTLFYSSNNFRKTIKKNFQIYRTYSREIFQKFLDIFLLRNPADLKFTAFFFFPDVFRNEKRTRT